MSPEPLNTPPLCAVPNFFNSVFVPAVERRLPDEGSIAAKVLDHTTGIRPFIQTLSQDLCEDGRIGPDSARQAVSFVSRSSASAIVAGGSIALASLGIVVGSPLAALGGGLAGLAILPPLAERAAVGVSNFFGELLQGVRGERETDSAR